jgi:hypothetical protein
VVHVLGKSFHAQGIGLSEAGEAVVETLVVSGDDGQRGAGMGFEQTSGYLFKRADAIATARQQNERSG